MKKLKKENETKLKDIIKILVIILDNQYNQENSPVTEKDDDNLIHCDHCIFNC